MSHEGPPVFNPLIGSRSAIMSIGFLINVALNGSHNTLVSSTVKS